MKNKNMNMLTGTLWDKILLFALPLALSSILQQLFNSADIAIVGRFAGSNALAAVGSNGPIVNLLVNIFVGLSIGSNVIISRYIGEDNKKKISDAVHTSVCIAFLSGIFIMIVGIIAARPILEMMSSPEEIIDLAAVYLKIFFIGMPFQMLYNFTAAILRSRGDTKRPLIVLTISGIINVCLNLFFVIVMHQGVIGVAVSTVISELISAIIMLYFLLHEDSDLKLYVNKIAINTTILKEIAKIGIPSGIQGMVFSASNVIIQTSMNSLGSTVVAASAAALNFEIFAYYMLNGFEHAAVTFTSQNMGALNFKRCTKVTYTSLLLGLIFTGTLCLLFIIFSKNLIRFYTTDLNVIEIALVRMRTIMAFEILNMALEVFSGSMRGFGYSLVPALISAFGICGVRIIWIATAFKAVPSFKTLVAVYPISWIVTCIAIYIAYLIVRKHIYSNKKDCDKTNL